ncbi:PspC domain-containing protein [Nocardioides aurantiacus]|uniref:Phage shock protein C (PspC) family protein n=1 Tax=Nocardioides aurantiacus TaxID=86796 RepID=A0A3N2CRB1_9ACTN|nr:PspC domain-containing protein [Nocardioides aurantiacus]ROR90061.1 phage shock protein C (PspC) family protein [Nocardioides aurantiacus]
MTEQTTTPTSHPTGQPTTHPTGQPRPLPQQPPPPYRRLVRTDGPLAGVCGGVGAYLGVDPTVVRVLAVLAMVLTLPVGPLVYLVLWAVVPRG